MLKQLKTLVKSMKETNSNDMSEVITLGVSVLQKTMKLGIILARLSLVQKIFYIKHSKAMSDFILNEKSNYDDIVVRVEYKHITDGEALATEIRRQVVQQGYNMPFEIHIYTEDDVFGMTNFKYILSDVREGDTGLNTDLTFWALDGKGKVFSYMPLDWESYVEYVKTQKGHFYKSAFCPDEPNIYNEDIQFITLEF